MADTSKLVLIAVDESSTAEHAFNFYVHHIHKKENRLLVIHASEPPTIPKQYMGPIPMAMMSDLNNAWDRILQEEAKKVEQLERKFAKKMSVHRLTGDVKVSYGKNAGELIVTEATLNGACLVVMGSRGCGTVRRTVLGSVSDYVLHHAPCPVVISTSRELCEAREEALLAAESAESPDGGESSHSTNI